MVAEVECVGAAELAETGVYGLDKRCWSVVCLYGSSNVGEKW